LKLKSQTMFNTRGSSSSIHPQGWVPIETVWDVLTREQQQHSSIHPQGWVPIETRMGRGRFLRVRVAFTPKGGCPLKLAKFDVDVFGVGGSL